MEQMEHPTGNTKSRAWCMTINNYIDDDIEMVKCCDCYVFQEERGTEGTPHLQCVIRWKNPRSFLSMKKMFPRAHIEKCKSWKLSCLYCSKLDTRCGKMWNNCLPEEVEDEFVDLVPKWWQLEIMELIKEKPDKRKVYWYWEDGGNVGKTIFCKHLYLKYGAEYVSGKAADIKAAIVEAEVKPKIIVWDLVRSIEDFVSYEGLESVKNGIFFSGKYKSSSCVFNIPHVFVFANFPPDERRLSNDRWVIKKIDEEK